MKHSDQFLFNLLHKNKNRIPSIDGSSEKTSILNHICAKNYDLYRYSTSKYVPLSIKKKSQQLISPTSHHSTTVNIQRYFSHNKQLTKKTSREKHDLLSKKNKLPVLASEMKIKTNSKNKLTKRNSHQQELTIKRAIKQMPNKQQLTQRETVGMDEMIFQKYQAYHSGKKSLKKKTQQTQRRNKKEFDKREQIKGIKTSQNDEEYDGQKQKAQFFQFKKQINYKKKQTISRGYFKQSRNQMAGWGNQLSHKEQMPLVFGSIDCYLVG